mgnify:CR=1 FL=1
MKVGDKVRFTLHASHHWLVEDTSLVLKKDSEGFFTGTIEEPGAKDWCGVAGLCINSLYGYVHLNFEDGDFVEII